MTSVNSQTGPRRALVVRGGWAGHVPVEATDRYVPVLESQGFDVTVSDTLDSYLDADALAATDLIVNCWTMGTITGDQAQGLARAVAAGTGLAGWHGGIVDSFRDQTLYQLVTGGQFVHHPRGFVEYQVDIVADRSDHPIVAGLDSFSVTTEQYYLHVDASNDVLATSVYLDDPDVPGLAGRLMPVVWTRPWGAGRVAVNAIGHKLDDFEVPEVDAIITRSFAWASR
jgi:type 1 glutamine amidotransferase